MEAVVSSRGWGRPSSSCTITWDPSPRDPASTRGQSSTPSRRVQGASGSRAPSRGSRIVILGCLGPSASASCCTASGGATSCSSFEAAGVATGGLPADRPGRLQAWADRGNPSQAPISRIRASSAARAAGPGRRSPQSGSPRLIRVPPAKARLLEAWIPAHSAVATVASTARGDRREDQMGISETGLLKSTQKQATGCERANARPQSQPGKPGD